MVLYDKYYTKENYFGDTYQELLDYFSTLDKNLKVLDLGVGQGRDALPISRLGFDVTGVDISEVGINQMNKVAKEENLQCKGIVEDMYQYDVSPFDVILLNSMFHFYKNDLQQETKFLHQIIEQMKKGSIIIIAVQHSKKRLLYLKRVLRDKDLTITLEKQVEYKEYPSIYDLVVAMKNT